MDEKDLLPGRRDDPKMTRGEREGEKGQVNKGMDGLNLDGRSWIRELLPVVRLLTPKIDTCHIRLLFHPSFSSIYEDYRFFSLNPEDTRP